MQWTFLFFFRLKKKKKKLAILKINLELADWKFFFSISKYQSSTGTVVYNLSQICLRLPADNFAITSWSRGLTQNDDILVHFGNFWQNLNTGLKKVFGIFFNLSKLFTYPRLLTLFQVSTVLGLIKLQKERLSYKNLFVLTWITRNYV